jgi:cysteine-rich repeat protein
LFGRKAQERSSYDFPTNENAMKWWILAAVLWASCTDPRCGDGIVDAGEACDDGNTQNGDGCQAACVLPLCGDGIIDIPQGEQCDDANADDGDTCTRLCLAASCGDGFVQRGVEECDEGAENSDSIPDACRSNCAAAFCGDAVIDSGEACDEGDANADTAGALCRNDCALPSCGDGFLDAGEACDDGDSNNNDGCDADCQPSAVVQLAVGDAHACALLRTGEVRCWGNGSLGRLGYGNTDDIGDNEFPSTAGEVNIGGRVTQLAAGTSHTCALLENGAVRCWGLNFSGQLGYGHTFNIGDDEPPASAGDVLLGGPAVEIAAGGIHSCARLATGSVVCWGSNDFGQLGYGNTVQIGDNETPLVAGAVDVGPGVVAQLALGVNHSCVLLETGAVRCWGKNDSGQLGYGNTIQIGDDETPSIAGDALLGFLPDEIDAGLDNTCARVNGAGLHCWGSAFGGKLGYGNLEDLGDDELPTSAGDINLGGPISAFSIGSSHSCALLVGGQTRCWGLGNDGVLGYGNEISIGDNETPASAGNVNVGALVVGLSVNGYSCALLDNGGLRCWGKNNKGQLGYGNTNDLGDNEIPAGAGDIPLF